MRTITITKEEYEEMCYSGKAADLVVRLEPGEIIHSYIVDPVNGTHTVQIKDQEDNHGAKEKKETIESTD